MTHQRLLKIGELSEMLGGRSRASVYRDILNLPGFPQPIKIGGATRFRLSDVESYIASLPTAADNEAA